MLALEEKEVGCLYNDRQVSEARKKLENLTQINASQKQLSKVFTSKHVCYINWQNF
jgi:hypothetical protein